MTSLLEQHDPLPHGRAPTASAPAASSPGAGTQPGSTSDSDSAGATARPHAATARPRRFPSSAAADPAPLRAPLRFAFSGRTAPNRLHKAPLTERLATWHATDHGARGVPTPALTSLYRRWGAGGYGLIATGNIMVDAAHLEARGNMVIPRDAPFPGATATAGGADARFAGFAALAAAAKRHGSLVVAQLSHPGRQVSADVHAAPISASDVQLTLDVFGHSFARPRPMLPADFDAVVGGFAHAAEYCYAAGFDGVEIHAAHGYLLAQFLAHTTNKRTDQYGGPLLNRARLIFEISAAIRQRVPASFIVGIKINSVEFQAGGFTPEDCRLLCLELEKHRFDFVELSGGTYEAIAFTHKRESSRKREAFFLDFADMIVPELTQTKAYITGGLRTVGAMVKALQTVHGIGLGRPVCHEYDLATKLLEGRVQGALDLLVDETDYGITDLAGGAQMRLVGDEKEPLDLTREDHMRAFTQSVEGWFKVLAEDKDGLVYGWPKIKGVELQPYGTPYGIE